MRDVFSAEEQQMSLGVSRRVNSRFQVVLVLAHDTGHRTGAIRQLGWSDMDLEDRTIR